MSRRRQEFAGCWRRKPLRRIYGKCCNLDRAETRSPGLVSILLLDTEHLRLELFSRWPISVNC